MTLSLAVGAAVIWLVLGVIQRVISATHPRSLADRALTAFALFFYSMPSFLLGLVLLYFLYFRLTLAGLCLVPGRRVRAPEPGHRTVGPAPAAALGRPSRWCRQQPTPG